MDTLEISGKQKISPPLSKTLLPRVQVHSGVRVRACVRVRVRVRVCVRVCVYHGSVSRVLRIRFVCVASLEAYPTYPC